MWLLSSKWVPIFVWVLINGNVVVVIKMGAYICMGAYKRQCGCCNQNECLYLYGCLLSRFYGVLQSSEAASAKKKLQTVVANVPVLVN